MSERETVELTGPFTPQTTTYSVSKRRAQTEDDQDIPSAMVERAGPPTPTAAASTRLPRLRAASIDDRRAAEPAPTWRVELAHDRIWIRSEHQELELPVNDAREVARLLLRAIPDQVV